MNIAGNYSILVCAALALGVAGAITIGAEPKVGTMLSHEVQQTKIEQMQSALEKRDIDSSRRLLKEAYDLWKAASNRDDRQARSPFLEEMITECYSFGVDEAQAQKRAVAALAKPDDITAEVELNLVERVTRAVQNRHVARYARSFEHDEEARVEAARLFSHALARFEAEIDPTWTPAKLTEQHDRETRIRLQIGVDAATAQREAAILDKEGPALVASNIHQWKLHQAARHVVPALEKRLIFLYSQPPWAEPELERYMKQFGVKSETANRILQGIPDPVGAVPTKPK